MKPRSTSSSSAALVLAVALFSASCSITTSNDQVSLVGEPELPTDVVAPEAPSADTPPAETPAAETPTDPAPTEPTLTEPTPTEPTATAEAAATPEAPADDSPVIVEGGDWAITQNEFDELIAVVEETHQLTFSDPVGVVVSDDIGQEFARGFEPFDRRDWALMRGLGLASTEDERLQANQLRLDRIRGFCCTGTAEGQAVVVELQGSKFATALIVVHELTHALHSQHPELAPPGFETEEMPFPAAAAFEGVPMFVTFEFMRTGSAQDQAAVQPDLPIIPDDMLDLIQGGAARHLNFAYATGPAFVAAVVAERGFEGLSAVMISPPVTTEQVLFPEKYLSGEAAVPVEAPVVPAGAAVRGNGTIGSAMFWFLLTDQNGVETARQIIEPWSGDSYVVYERDTQLCLAANVVMDSDAAASSFAEFVNESIQAAAPTAELDATVAGGGLISLTACHP